ncbi:MAG: hypothetical protein M3O50_11270 [Myxococcota bacterium]|nr:hypothetical protein [Myxococcota bacterium]
MFTDGFKSRRTSSDPGRALLSGFVFSGDAQSDGSCAHSPCGPDQKDSGGSSMSRRSTHQQDRTLLSRRQRGDPRDVVVHCEEFFKRVTAVADPAAGAPPIVTTDGVHIDRPNVPPERSALVAYLETL